MTGPGAGPVGAGVFGAGVSRAGVLRAEVLKALTVRTWWALGIPVALLAVTINLFGGLFDAAVGDLGTGGSAILLASLAYALSLTSVFAGVFGTVSASAEFRHHTVTTSYLLAGRGPTLLAKSAVAAAVGAGYALVAAVLGVLAGILGQGGARMPDVGGVVAVVLIGIVVCALWGALGVALGTVLTNQAGAVVVLLVYVLAAENLVSLALRAGQNDGSPPGALARITSFLPGNAGDVALYDLPGRALGGQYGTQIVEQLAGVAGPPPWWGALPVLLVWTGAALAVAWVVGDRRDVT